MIFRFMEIKIKDKIITLKLSLRSLLMYENCTQKSFNPQNFSDIITYFYCIVVCSSKDYSLSFDEFIDYIDENPVILEEMTKWLDTELTNNNILKKN